MLAGLAIFVVYRLLQFSGLLGMLTDSESLGAWIAQSGFWGPIALAAGAAFGHAWGTLYVVTGATLGAVIAFTIARRLGFKQMQRLFGERLQLGWLGSQSALMGMVFLSRLIPFISFDLVSYGAGLTSLKTWRFVLATVAGLVPASFLLAHVGGELTATGLNRTMYALLLLGLLIMAPVVFRAGVKLWRHRQWRADKKRISDR